MGRILAFDFGTKRVGIAVTDELQLIASGLKTVETKDVFTFLSDFLKKEKVSLFVVGEPKQMNNQPSESEVHIKVFIKELAEKFPEISIERVDERFTSKMAVQTMVSAGFKKKYRQDKALIDQISATIILQTYLNRSDVKRD